MFNKVGEIRPAQLITTFGPGSILDALKDSVTILDINYWKNDGLRISDPRLARYLDVDYFMSPRVSKKEDLPVVSFPNSHVCSNNKCNRLFNINESFELNQYLKFGPKCPDCGKFSYPARFIVSCLDGHMDDFPWRWWAHEGHSDCTSPLRLESTGHTSSLGDLIVKCDCGANNKMTGATVRENFDGYQCTGRHPHKPSLGKNSKGIYSKCNCNVIPLQRGASNVYFPVIRSAISIPPWTNPLHLLIDEHYREILNLKEYNVPDAEEKVYEKHFKGNYTKADFMDALKRREENIKEYTEIKEMEYQAIVNYKDSEYSQSAQYFKASEEEMLPYLKPFFNRVIKVERLREVMVLLGFMRIDSPEPEVDEPPRIVKLSVDHQDKWLPGVKINGEGIFIELNKEYVKKWLMNNKENQEISKQYKNIYNNYVAERGWNNAKERDAVYVLLHTLAHILIKELSLQCGYSSASIKERIYFSESMCGLLLYTGSSDKEGSLGGLVEMGRNEKFINLLSEGLKNALTCTTDPKCMIEYPSRESELNGSSCHSCTMISETSCESGNRLLDRSLLVSLPEKNIKGFFDDLVKDLCGIVI